MLSLRKFLYCGRTYSLVEIDLSDRRESEPVTVIVNSPDDNEGYLLTTNETYDLGVTLIQAAMMTLGKSL